MNRKVEEARQRVVIRDPQGADSRAQSTRKTTFIAEEGGTSEVTVVSGPACANCGHAILTDDQIGGICRCGPDAGHLVCAECTTRRCEICRAICCDQRSCSSILFGAKVCNRHGFVEYMRLALTR